MASYFKDNIKFKNPVVIVAANPACMKKAISFRKELQTDLASPKIATKSTIESEHAVFIHSFDPDSDSEFLGKFFHFNLCFC